MRNSATFLLIPALAIAIALPAAAVEPPQRLPRASGLWKVIPSTPFFWEICVDQAKDRLVDDDLWSGFEQECKIESKSGDGEAYSVDAVCPSARMVISFKGDLVKSYTLSVVTAYDVQGKTETVHTVVNGSFQGACPADMEPGVKKMRGGLKLKSLYIDR